MISPLLPDPPATATVLARASDPSRDRSYVALDGDTLWVRDFACVSCRRQTGLAFRGDVTKLCDRALRAVQRSLGLPDRTPLRTGAAWRAQIFPPFDAR